MRGQAAHPDAEVLAEFRAGLISGMRGRRLAAHLAGCSRCAATAAALASVSAALAAVPVPSLPDPVAARISMALAVEASARAAVAPVHAAGASANGEAAVVGTGNGHRARPPRGRRRSGAGGRWLRPVRPAILVPAAVCLLLVAGGGYLLSLLGSSPGPSAASAHAGASPAIVFSPGAGGPHPLHISPSTPVGGTSAPGSGGTKIRVVASGTDYQPATLRAEVEAVEARLRMPPTTATATLSECALRVTHGTTPVFVDKARYQTRPAYVIVTDHKAWVVGTSCTAASPDPITSVSLSLASTGAGISTP